MTEMKKHIYDENNGLWYELIGDYYIPVLTLPSEEQRPIGKWGRMHRDYLKEHRPILYNDLILSGQFWTYLADLNEQAQERLSLIIEHHGGSFTADEIGRCFYVTISIPICE